MHIRKGDTVVVLTGSDKRKKGKVLAVYPKQRRIIVEGVNFVKQHLRPKSANQQGGIVEKEAPIHLSNVMSWCESAGKPSKIVMKQNEDGSRVRAYKINGETVKDNK